jgi:hypothetical protein
MEQSIKGQIITRLTETFVESGGDVDSLDEFIRNSVDFDVIISRQEFETYVVYNFTFEERTSDLRVASVTIMKQPETEEDED